MAVTPTTLQLAKQNLVTLEGRLAQTSPLNDKAFLRVLAVMLAMGHTGLYKLLMERSRQNLALTATKEDLDRIGNSAEVSVFRKLSEAASLKVSIPAAEGIVIPITAMFVGDLNGELYNVSAPAIAGEDGRAVVTVTASNSGVNGNLQPADTLSIVQPLPSVGARAVVTTVENVGTEDESDDEYRPRILFKMRSAAGGGNGTSYKSWAEEVAGVVRAFPYSGKPVGAGVSYPGDRTVYIQADTDIDADGVPSQGLLDEVREALNYDPTTGASRPALGLVDTTLYVEPITRSEVDVTITDLDCIAGTEADVRSQITASLRLFFLLFAPYIDGVDLRQDRNDRITTTAISTVLQEIFDATGSSAASVSFSVGGVTYSAYQLAAGELTKLGAVGYVVA